MFIYNAPCYPRTIEEKIFKQLYKISNVLLYIALIVTFTDYNIRIDNTFDKYWGSSSVNLSSTLNEIVKNCSFSDEVGYGIGVSRISVTGTSALLISHLMSSVITGMLAVLLVLVVIDNIMKYMFMSNVRHLRIRGTLIPVQQTLVVTSLIIGIYIIISIGVITSFMNFMDKFVKKCENDYRMSFKDSVVTLLTVEYDSDTVFGTDLWLMFSVAIVNVVVILLSGIKRLYNGRKREELKLIYGKYPWLIRGTVVCRPNKPLLTEYTKLRRRKVQEIKENPFTSGNFDPVLIGHLGIGNDIPTDEQTRIVLEAAGFIPYNFDKDLDIDSALVGCTKAEIIGNNNLSDWDKNKLILKREDQIKLIKERKRDSDNLRRTILFNFYNERKREAAENRKVDKAGEELPHSNECTNEVAPRAAHHPYHSTSSSNNINPSQSNSFQQNNGNWFNPQQIKRNSIKHGGDSQNDGLLNSIAQSWTPSDLDSSNEGKPAARADGAEGVTSGNIPEGKKSNNEKIYIGCDDVSDGKRMASPPNCSVADKAIIDNTRSDKDTVTEENKEPDCYLYFDEDGNYIGSGNGGEEDIMYAVAEEEEEDTNSISRFLNVNDRGDLYGVIYDGTAPEDNVNSLEMQSVDEGKGDHRHHSHTSSKKRTHSTSKKDKSKSDKTKGKKEKKSKSSGIVYSENERRNAHLERSGNNPLGNNITLTDDDVDMLVILPPPLSPPRILSNTYSDSYSEEGRRSNSRPTIMAPVSCEDGEEWGRMSSYPRDSRWGLINS